MLLMRNDSTHVINVLFICLFVIIQTDLIDDRFRVLYSRNMKCDHNRNLNLNVSETFIYFYDFVNNINVSSPIDTAAEQIQDSIEFDYKRRLIVFVPGYKCHINRDVEESIRQTFKDILNVYLIIVDHSAYTYENQAKIDSYIRSVLYSYYIGSSLGTFLVKLKFASKNIHCIGHSLGSHIVGYAGENYRNITNEYIWRITGLDPAGPCFSKSPIEEQVRSGQAEYVEIYHCNAGHLGTTQVLGDVDFFFNYRGKIQPNCDSGNIEDIAKCYHKSCVKYWMKSVHNHNLYIGRYCSSYEEFADGVCDSNETATAGYYNPGTAKGKFYITTEIIK